MNHQIFLGFFTPCMAISCSLYHPLWRLNLFEGTFLTVVKFFSQKKTACAKTYVCKSSLLRRNIGKFDDMISSRFSRSFKGLLEKCFTKSYFIFHTFSSFFNFSCEGGASKNVLNQLGATISDNFTKIGNNLLLASQSIYILLENCKRRPIFQN